MNHWVRIAALSMAAAASPAAAEVVLLHNGSVLEGVVQRLADEVILQQPGGTVRLRTAEVAHVCPTAVALYDWLRRTRIGRHASADEHLALAGWAIDNHLWPQAARELLDARQLDPRSRRLTVLERRFDELTRPDPPARRSPPGSGVVLASHEVPVQTAEAAEEPLPRMPEGTLEFFTRRVQPLLRHGCATAGCHRSGDDEHFRLDPDWLHGHSDARSTERNLRATLAEIDMGSPANSRLLRAAAGPHHGATPISGPRREELLAKLSAWVHAVASLNPVELPPPPESEAMPATGEPLVEPRDAYHQDTAVAPAAFQVDPPVRGGLVRGGQVRRVGPRDEFDPAIFNGRFRRPEDDQPLSERSATTR